MNYLYAAYAATWIIHIGYIVILTAGFAKVRDEIKELKKK